MNGAATRKPRELELSFERYERWWYMKKQPKLTLNFSVMTPGEDFGKTISAHYRIDRFDKRGRSYAKPRSRIVRDLGRLFPDYVDQMPMPLSRLKGISAVGRTRWVTKDSSNVELAQQQQYEVIDCLLRRTNGQP